VASGQCLLSVYIGSKSCLAAEFLDNEIEEPPGGDDGTKPLESRSSRSNSNGGDWENSAGTGELASGKADGEESAGIEENSGLERWQRCKKTSSGETYNNNGSVSRVSGTTAMAQQRRRTMQQHPIGSHGRELQAKNDPPKWANFGITGSLKSKAGDSVVEADARSAQTVGNQQMADARRKMYAVNARGGKPSERAPDWAKAFQQRIEENLTQLITRGSKSGET